MNKRFYIIAAMAAAFVTPAFSQQQDSLLQNATLENVVQYALTHQPTVQQSLIDEQITERQIKGKLADWFPQLNLNYTVQHNFQIPQSVIGGQVIRLGVENTSTAALGLTQTIFNRDVLLASRSAKDVRAQARQNTSSNKINITVDVSKAFYDVLLTQEQTRVLEGDIVRLERSLKDATNQYKAGITDKTDYKRATIALNNSKAQKKQSEELYKARLVYLKGLMNYPETGQLTLAYDSARMEQEAFIDTVQNTNLQNRIEYQMLQTQKRLQEANLKYAKWSFLPNLSLFGNYNFSYLNNQFSKLYSNNLPNSNAGLTLAFPIFQGTKRVQEIRQAELELKRVDYDLIALKNNVNSEYSAALATYKSNLNTFYVLKENLDLAQDVYNTIQLQYKSGVKTYLEVINAETDLRTARINYTNALYNVLSAKIDVQKALGQFQY
ncbi:TolC family protein [Foetidibacter luteolus]|uniref:TolC family protein n=1 Tax=Foetidibacter luteolus TaxID=2608880 RepID=UPI00129ABA65|nr:TolC family protein [Foetidibacter luteolus]